MEVVFERKGLEKKFFETFKGVIEAQGFKLYDLEYLSGQSLLRISIENPQTKTATIEECVKVDHSLDSFFENETWIPDTITLEVSSPGVYRNLRSLEQMQESLGEIVACTIIGKLDYPELAREFLHQNKFRGKLKSANEVEVTLEINGKEVFIPLMKIKRVNVDPDFNMNSKKV